MRKILLLGASGSIGRQVIDILRNDRKSFVLTSFSVGHHDEIIESIINDFSTVKHIFLIDERRRKELEIKYPNIIFTLSLEQLMDLADFDMVVNALVGFVGLKPTLKALENNKIVALANKESLVIGGELIKNLLDNGHGKLFPIDSEHVALAKCLNNHERDDVKRLIITASGGAFRSLNREQLENVKKEDALKHPSWLMGEKITIDCASMMNKAFEVVEAYYLFGFKKDMIDVILHDESKVHSFVEFKDNSFLADIGPTDMRIPISYAMYEGKMMNTPVKPFDLKDFNIFHFHELDENRYPFIKLGYRIIEEKGILGAIINSANEVAVNLFLQSKIKFLDIERIVFYVLENTKNKKVTTYDELKEASENAKEEALKYVREKRL